MGDKKEEGRRSILGNLGDVFIPRSRSSSPKPGNNPAPARFDLSKCQFHETVTISFVLFISYTIQQIKHTFFLIPTPKSSAETVNRWLTGVPDASNTSVTAPITFHRFILSDNVVSYEPTKDETLPHFSNSFTKQQTLPSHPQPNSTTYTCATCSLRSTK